MPNSATQVAIAPTDPPSAVDAVMDPAIHDAVVNDVVLNDAALNNEAGWKRVMDLPCGVSVEVSGIGLHSSRSAEAAVAARAWLSVADVGESAGESQRGTDRVVRTGGGGIASGDPADRNRLGAGNLRWLTLSQPGGARSTLATSDERERGRRCGRTESVRKLRRRKTKSVSAY